MPVPNSKPRSSEAAANFALAAREAGVRRIIYLGGLAHGDELSPHMRSRTATGNILRSSGIPVIEFQASIIIGSGSASFEMIRALVERLPVMVTPRWVNTAAQPIAIEDVIEYLAAATRLPIQGNLTVEIGGSDVTSYVGIMREFARQRKLRRWIVRVPFLSLSLSSRWLTLITPVYASIGRCLIESVRHPSVVRNPNARELFTHSAHGNHPGHRAGLGQRGPSRRGEPLVRRQRAGRRPEHRAGTGPRSPDQRTDDTSAPDARSGIRPDSPDRRPHGLVLRQPACGGFAGAST